MSDPTIKDFNPGGIIDRVDHRDYQYTEVGFGTSPFDWIKGYDIESELGAKLPVKDQNGSFSCGGQAWATYATVLEAIFTGTVEERSAKFFYAQTYQKTGGSTGRDNANVFVNEGACRESVLISYQNGQPPNEAFMTKGQDITPEARNDALSDKSFSYSQVEPASMDEIARALRDNNGVILGIDGEDNGTWLSAFPQPPVINKWRHWIYAGRAKMINGKKYIGCLNSWGSQIGEQGWQYLGEEYFTTGHVWSAWTHVYNPEPLPPAFTHNFKVDLRKNDSGSEVKALQTALQLDGVFPQTVPTTGFFGDITLTAVKAYQTKYHVSPVSGFVGPLTRAVLNNQFNH